MTTEFHADPSTLSCDEEQLVQVFLNLLLNALQILPEEGTIMIRTAIDGDQLVIEVADTGPGIPRNIASAYLILSLRLAKEEWG